MFIANWWRSSIQKKSLFVVLFWAIFPFASTVGEGLPSSEFFNWLAGAGCVVHQNFQVLYRSDAGEISHHLDDPTRNNMNRKETEGEGETVGHRSRPRPGSGEKEKQMERGLFAKGNLQNDTVLFEISMSSMLNIEHALSNRYNPKFHHLIEPLSDTDAMAAFIAVQALNESHWYSLYFSSLPKVVNTPLLFPEKARQLWLKGSTLDDYSQRRKAASARSYDNLPQLLKSTFNLNHWRWALSIVWSRLFSIKVQDSSSNWHSASVLIPLADLLNTHLTSNVECHTSNENRFVCKTTKFVADGDELYAPYGMRVHSLAQIYNDYGVAFPLTNIITQDPTPEWTNTWGSTLAGHEFNAKAVVAIRLSLHIALTTDKKGKPHPTVERIASTLSSHTDMHLDYHIKSPPYTYVDSPISMLSFYTLFSPKFLIAVRILSLTEFDIKQFDESTLIETLITRSSSLTHEIQFASMLRFIFQSHLAAFPTTIQEDEQVLMERIRLDQNNHLRPFDIETQIVNELSRPTALIFALREEKILLHNFTKFAIEYLNFLGEFDSQSWPGPIPSKDGSGLGSGSGSDSTKTSAPRKSGAGSSSDSPSPSNHNSHSIDKEL